MAANERSVRGMNGRPGRREYATRAMRSTLGTALVSALGRLHGELERELGAYQAHLVARHAGHESEQALRKEEVEERLRALGYIQ